MGWVNDAQAALTAGRAVKVRPTGDSMRGRIESGQLVSLIPVEDPATVKVGDAVMVAWKGGYLLHLVLEATDRLLLIGNNVGGINGWVQRSAVLGKVVAVED
jgi:hypothetical protein